MKMVSWNITRRCNLKCQHCYRDSGPEAGSLKNELNTEQGKNLLEELKAEGFAMVILSGGEPLLREDLVELVTYASSLDLYPVLGTNAVNLTEDKIKELQQAGLKGMGISIDSSEAHLHDEFRRVEGSWEYAVGAAKKAVELNMSVQINATISRDNKDDIEGMIRLAEDIGARAFHPFFLVPTGRGKEIEEAALRPEEYQRMIEYVLKKSQETDIEIKPTCAPQFMVQADKMDLSLRYSRGCLAGVSYCCILPEGEVHICPYLPVSLGNVKEKSFAEIWQENEKLQNLRDYTCYEGECGQCEYVDICGGCRARAYYYSRNNILAADPWCRVKEGG